MDTCQGEAARSIAPCPLESGTSREVIDQADKGGPTFFALDEEEDSDLDDDMPLQRQNSLDERYDAFEAMSRASLNGEIKRQELNAAMANTQPVQAFNLEEEDDDLADEVDDPPKLRRSASFDWQYDALDAGNAIAAVAVAGEAGMPCDVSSPTFYCDGGRPDLGTWLDQDVHQVPALPGADGDGPGERDSSQACTHEEALSGRFSIAEGSTGAT